MKTYFSAVQLFLLILISNAAFAQWEWKSNKDRMVIPFELTHNLIMVDVVLNGISLKMVLDTGSENNVIFTFPEEEPLDFKNTRKVFLKGLGSGEELEAYQATGNNFRIHDLVDTNFNVLLIANQEIGIVNNLGIPINGILGTSFFKDFLVEINYAKKKLYVYRDEPERFVKKTKKYTAIDIKFNGLKPFVDIEVSLSEADAGQTVSLLFDSGLGDGLWLFENDTLRCTQDFFVDVLGKGINGDVTGKKSRVRNLNIIDFNLQEALVSYPDSLSISRVLLHERNGSLGGEIIKRFNWFLDYKNQKFYFKKNKFYEAPFHYNMSGISVQHAGIEWVKEQTNSLRNGTANSFVKVDQQTYLTGFTDPYKFSLKPIFIIHAVRENSPAARVGLKKGDRILSINGKKGYQYNIQSITDLLHSEEGKKIKIEVERNGMQLRYYFYLEKIL